MDAIKHAAADIELRAKKRKALYSVLRNRHSLRLIYNGHINYLLSADPIDFIRCKFKEKQGYAFKIIYSIHLLINLILV